MAPQRLALIILLLSLFTFSSSRAENGGIAVYWGQDAREGNLIATCDSGKYAIVLLAFLHQFGAGRTPTLNFAGHCGDSSGRSCGLLQPQINYCQAKGIKCPTDPIPYLGKAIATNLFDYIFVQFYDNPSCSYTDGTSALLESWDKWVDSVASNNSLFVGVPAAPSAGDGYIPPEVLNDEVLPHAKEASNYGGVMLWDRYRDVQNGYSDSIMSNVIKSKLKVSVVSVSDAIYRGVSKALRRLLVY
ncbi:chitinase [Vigna unguiculata]|uniref:Chitinase n=1 Tax=Vigna unguiculata TaxID=3917 RepID=A0A4D6LC42_VIGUN|nr:chitinase [Vigna unguiculata]